MAEGNSNSQNKIIEIFADARAVTSLENRRNIIKKLQNNPAPAFQYVICVTPRSGSSWLRQILLETRIMGDPDEWFNPGFLPQIIGEMYPSLDPIEYFDCLTRTRCSSNKVFGIKMSFFQYQLACEALDSIRKGASSCLFGEEKIRAVYLYRLDLVGQAVSLYRATKTGFFHSTQKDAVEKSLVSFNYSKKEIWEWLFHILAQEYGWRQAFHARGIMPLALTYEDLCGDPQLTKMRIIHFVLGNQYHNIPSDQDSVAQDMKGPSHLKIATSRSREIVNQFYEENRSAVDFCLENRGIMDIRETRKRLGI